MGESVWVHDFSGHPFQAQLSRVLAARGLSVEHVYAMQYVSGKGQLEHRDDDPASLTFAPLRVTGEFRKYSLLARLRFEWSYGRAWVRRLAARGPAPGVMCNVPLLALFVFAVHARGAGIRWVFWHQDIYAYGLAAELHRRLPRPLAGLGARVAERMEAFCARQADHVVAIGSAFCEVYPAWGVDAERVSVIPNWAPLDSVFPVPRDNPKAAALFGEARGLRLLYAGTLGRKHNPDLLVELLRMLRSAGVEAHLTVVSEGEAADDLARIAAAEPRLGLRVVGFQPAEDFPAVLGSADAVVALLEPDATRFSIPSKVLSYMAAGRPIAGLVPADNPAAADILATGGIVAEPDPAGVRIVARWLTTLAADPRARDEIGRRAREVAEAKFDVADVADRFAALLGAAAVAR